MVDVEEADKNTIGFIVVNGYAALYGTLTGTTREVLHTFEANIPEKFVTGQCALEFSRLRSKAHQDYLDKIALVATQIFINPETEEPNVAGLVLSGTIAYQTYLSKPGDPPVNRLLAGILKSKGLTDFSSPVMATILSVVKGGLTFDPRLRAKILDVVLVSDGGEKGFDEAIAKFSS